MKLKIKFYTFLILLLPFLSKSQQEVLMIEDAIGIALENNYGIQVTRLEQKAAVMQVYKSNAGMGPFVNWDASLNVSGSRVNQQFLDGRVNNRFGRAIAPNTGITVGMTVFDGGRMQAIYDRLGLLGQFSELQAKVIVQNTIVNVMQAYYDVILQKEILENLDIIIEYYQERLQITEQRWNVGRGSKLDYLQSGTELNTQRSEKVRVTNNLKNAKVRLNGILNRDLQTDFDIFESEEERMTENLAGLIDMAKSKNREVILMQKSLDISRKQEEEWEATLKPQVDISAGFGYAYSNTNAGFLTSNQSFAIPLGVSARWTIYDGNHRKNQIAIARVNSDMIELQQQDLEVQIITDLTLSYNQYTSDKELLALEEENKTIAEENLFIALEKFRLGASSILELNEAQRAYNVSLNRLVNAQFSIKLSELELFRLSGALIN